jgi:hypothetical protein
MSILMLHFLVSPVAILFISVGFARSMNDSPRIGENGDADFWWLLAGTALALQANILTIVQLFRDGFSYAQMMAWLFLALSTCSGAVSVPIYLHANTAWSSMLASLSAYFAIAAMIVPMQGVGKSGVLNAETGLGQRQGTGKMKAL